mgnify:CR=1 FL=1
MRSGHSTGVRSQVKDNDNYGPLYDLAQNKDTKLIGDKALIEFRQNYDGDKTDAKGTNPDNIWNTYALRMFSIATEPFTGTLGNFRTVNDTAVAWRDTDGNDCVTIFKTKINASKQFDGFEDGKLAIQDAIGSQT